MKNYLITALALTIVVSAPTNGMQQIAQDRGIEIVKETIAQNITKIVPPVGLNLFAVGGGLITIGLLRNEENSKPKKYSLTSTALDMVVKACEVTSIIHSDKISAGLTIRKLAPPVKRVSPTPPQISNIQHIIELAANSYTANHDLENEQLVINTVYYASKKSSLALSGAISGITGIHDLTKVFTAPSDEKLAYLVSGILHSGISAGLLYGSEGLVSFKKAHTESKEKETIKTFEQLLAKFLERLAHKTILAPKLQLVNGACILGVSGAGALFGIKSIVDASQELLNTNTPELKDSPAPKQSILPPIGKLLFGVLLIGGAVITIVNIEGLAGLAIEQNPDQKKQPAQKFLKEWITLITETVDKKIDRYFSLQNISCWLLND